MDPLSHCLVGGLTAKTVSDSKRRFWIMTLLGGFPDIDFIANSWGPWASFLQHRSMTHSFFGIFLLALMFSFLLRNWDDGPFGIRLFHYSLPLVFHIFCDLLTSFGVPLLLPFSERQFSLDVVGSVNILPIVIMGTALVWMHRKEIAGWRATRVVWVTWALYLCFLVTGKVFAAKITPMQEGPVTTLPNLYNPFSWRVVEQDTSLHVYKYFDVNLISHRSRPIGVAAMPGNDFPVQASMKSEMVQRLIKNNRWPVVRFFTTTEGWRVEWGNLIFSTRGQVRGKIVVDVSPEGKLRNESKVVDFWSPANS